MLFALYISDIDETFADQQCGGTVISRRLKSFFLAYADDLVLIAESPKELQEMLKVLNRYANRKRLTVNVDKSKVMRFAPGSRLSNGRWTYDGAPVEEFRSFKYLGYVPIKRRIVQSHPGDGFRGKTVCNTNVEYCAEEVHRQFCDKDANVSKYRPANYDIRLHEEIEVQARKYFRWTLGLQQSTRNAIVYDETKTYPVCISKSFRAKQ